MALRAPAETELQEQVCYPAERLQGTSQYLAAYYEPLAAYGSYRSALAAAEDLQSFPQLDSSVPAPQAIPSFPFQMAPPLLNPSLALQREPLYGIPWYGKLPHWYPVAQLPGEVPHFLSSSGEYPASSGDNSARNDGAPRSSGPDPVATPAQAAVVPTGLKTSPVVSRSPAKQSEDDPKVLQLERKSPDRFHFTEEDLHFVLYGITPSLEHPTLLQHAISGVLTPTGSPSSGSDSLPQALDKESLQLPEGLCLLQTMLGEVPHFGVFCSGFIAKGVRFGPFQGKMVSASEVKTHRDNSVMWEIFEDGHLSHFIDGKGTGNWMSYVNCARFPKEQNLVAVQCQGQIFYESCKEICQNQELLVWYGDCYEKFLDIPVNLQLTEQGRQPAAPVEESAEGFHCERCGKVFTYKYYRDKHLKYTPCVDKGDRKFPCSLCKRSFEKRDRLRIHILHVHEKHRPHKCSTCGKCFSQSSSLNKHMRVHSGDRPYQCVYCTKKFTASSILRTHIRQHSGEKPFKCKYCGKSFASHAAHDSHVRRSHKEDEGCSW
ncbi:PR domain zinc finger protein 14 [Ochotona princeps]|uniref:PR domain zinc finger protein 14 n=1 Tax=Ochotona princeps TaxID=9978 RepID=UPI002714A4BD|nr:PR domain zinc finger protein 14 [Ochotona princeps]